MKRSCPMDRMTINDLVVRCIVGTKPEERTSPQDVCVNVMLECDLSKAGRSDRLDDTVNYSDLRRRVVSLAQSGRFRLVESMAEAMADECLSDRRVHAATVRVEKSGAVPGARSAGVEIRREHGRGGHKRR